ALGPVEADRAAFPVLRRRVVAVLSEEDRARILGARREQDHALPSLRDAEGASVEHSIGPRELAFLEEGNEVVHRSPAIELEHERHVLEEQPARRADVDEPEDLLHEARARSLDSMG